MKFLFKKIYFLDLAGNKEEILELDLLSNFLDLNKTNNGLKRNSIRERPYLLIDNSDIIFSNTVTNLVNYQLRSSIDMKICSSYLNSGFIPAPYTIYKDLFCIPLFSEVTINDNILYINNSFPDEAEPFDSQDSFEIFLESIINRIKNKDISLLFSGGADSLFILHKIRKNHLFKNIIVKMEGMIKEYTKAIKISAYYNINTITYNKDIESIYKNLDSYIEEKYEPIQDPISPVYKDIINKNLNSADDIFVDGQGADSLLMGLPHNLIINVYSPKRIKIFKLLNLIFFINVRPNTGFKRLYYRIKKVVNSLLEEDWKSCFLSLIDIHKNNELYQFYYKNISLYENEFKCKHKAISYFFLINILDSREMQKYRMLNDNVKILLPFLDINLINRVFSTNSSFFIKGIYKKIPIYSCVNKYKFKVSNFRTSPFFVDYSKDENTEDIFKYSIDKIRSIIK